MALPATHVGVQALVYFSFRTCSALKNTLSKQGKFQ
jgi:hypothetical protein